MSMKERWKSDDTPDLLKRVKNVGNPLIHVASQNVTTRLRLLNLGHSEETIDKFIEQGIYVEVGDE
jgi:hypothetical protein